MTGRARSAWRGLRHRRLRQRMAGPRLLRAFADAYPDAWFAEIGANDGDQHDFLRPLIAKGRWRGLVVEPVPYVFERLKANYGDSEQLILENVAVGDRDGRQRFYHLAQVQDHRAEGLPRWYDGIGSFSREEVLSHAEHIPDIEDRLVETEVPVATLETLCRRNGVEHLDLLLVDTEGYDWEVLRTVDLEALSPRVVIYEHYHLSAEDSGAAQADMKEHGYGAMEEHFDTFCLRAGIDDRLARTWGRLKPAVPGVAAYEETR